MKQATKLSSNKKIKLSNDTPLISVIMPVYNASKYLSKAVESIIEQSYTNWELIAIDDGSEDDSLSILKHLSKLDSRIKVLKNRKNLGVSKTSNYGISKAKGLYIVRMDADDISYSTRLAKQLKFLQEHPDYVVVGGQVKLIDKMGNFLRDKNFPEDHNSIYEMMYTAMSLQQGAMMVNRMLLPADFDWYNGVRTAEEVKLFFRLFNYGKFANLSSYVLKYRQYGTSTSLVNAKETFRITFKTRKLAIKKWNYVPTFKAKIINYIQWLIVAVLPNKFIYPLFISLRSIHLLKGKINVEIKKINELGFYKKIKKEIFAYV